MADSPVNEHSSPSAEESSHVAISKLTPAELQKRQLEKLLKRIDKPIVIPQRAAEKQLPPPKDIMRNVQGSSAGAGSGDFHVYRAHRRREYARQKLMDEKEKKEIEQEQFQQKMMRLKAEEEEQTAKRRAKRHKRKQKAATKKQKIDENNANNTNTSDTDAQIKQMGQTLSEHKSDSESNSDREN